MADQQRTNEALKKAIQKIQQLQGEERFQADRDLLLSTVGKDIADIMEPAIVQMVENAKASKDELTGIVKSIVEATKPIIEDTKLSKKEFQTLIKDAVKEHIPEINVSPPEVNVEAPKIVMPEIKILPIKIPELKAAELKIPPIKVPKPEVTVNIPPIKVPPVIMPEKIEVKGSVSLDGVDIDNPLPVTLKDKDGKSVNLLEGLSQVISGGGGGPRQVGIKSTTALKTGQKTVTTAGTQEVLATKETIKSITIKALAGNTGIVYIGDSSVDSSTGLELSAGESLSLDINEISLIYVDVATSGEGVSFIYVM